MKNATKKRTQELRGEVKFLISEVNYCDARYANEVKQGLHAASELSALCESMELENIDQSLIDLAAGYVTYASQKFNKAYKDLCC